MSIANTARLLTGTFGLAICAFGQIIISPAATTRTSNLPPIGIAGTETVQVILTNTAANPATTISVLGAGSTATVPAPSCAGSVSFYNAGGALIGTATAFTLTSGQIEQVSLPYASAGSLVGTAAGRTLIRAVVTLTTTYPSPPPCSLSYSLVTFDTTSGVTHAIVNDSGLTGIATPLFPVLSPVPLVKAAP
jgi:hypothetical protein